MPVTIPAGLQRDHILSAALTALKLRLISLGIFSTAFRNVKLEGTDKMVVPYYPLEGSASKDFNPANGYEFGDAYAQATREVTVDKRKYQPLSIDSQTFARQPQLNLEKIGQQKGDKLAEDIIMDILSLATAGEFGAAVHTGLAASLDFATVNEVIGTACDQAKWRKSGRSLAVHSGYYRNLVTDLGDASVYASDNPVKRGVLEGVAGFDVYNEDSIPGNAENLVGFAAYESAILIGFSPVEPKDQSRIVDYQTMSDEETGLTLEYRKWFDPNKDTEKSVIECNYGYEVGEAVALKRIISA